MMAGGMQQLMLTMRSHVGARHAMPSDRKPSIDLTTSGSHRGGHGMPCPYISPLEKTA
ncbi:MAG: hypothetical protein K0Q71_85 [Thermomicrobiales bacterium]|jgi:hypothetical protein|nr:hypothetical protein [Thermomicrobiales bacterium]